MTIAGVFDWEQMIREKKYDQFDNPTFGYLLCRLGDPKKEPEKFEAISPVRHVRQIRVPVFVSHGKEAPIADVAQSKRLVSELDRHRVPYEKFLVSEEDHGMGYLANEVELYGHVEVFLAKHLAAGAAR